MGSESFDVVENVARVQVREGSGLPPISDQREHVEGRGERRKLWCRTQQIVAEERSGRASLGSQRMPARTVHKSITYSI